MASSVSKKDWVKNVAKSTKYASINLVKSTAPTTTSMIEGSLAAFGEIKSFMARNKGNISITERVNENNSKTKSLLVEALNNIKTGNLAIDKISDGFDDDFMKELGFIDDDYESLGDEENLSPEVKSSNTTQKAVVESARIQSRAQIQAMKEMTNVITRSHMKTSDAISKRNANLIIGGFTKIDTSLGIINNSLVAINKNIMSLVQYQNDNRYKIDEKQLEFYDEAVTSMKKMQATFELQLEKKFDSGTDPFPMGFNLSDYKDIIKKNFSKSTPGVMLSMIPMLTGMSGAFMKDINLTSLALTAALGMIMPQKTMKSLGNFDKSIEDFTKNMLYRLGDYGKRGKGNILTNLIGEVFGIAPPTINKLTLDKYKKDSMQWNGKAQKTLTEVIPSYLARIESAITKQEERFFDLDKGKFTTKSRLKKDFEKDITSKVKFAQDDEILDLLDSYLNKQSPKNHQKYNRQIKTLLNQAAYGTKSMYTDVNPRLSNILQKKMGVSKKDAARIISGLNNGIYAGIDDINDFFYDISNGGSDVYRYLFNNDEKIKNPVLEPLHRVDRKKTEQQKKADDLYKSVEGGYNKAKSVINLGNRGFISNLDSYASDKLDALTTRISDMSSGSNTKIPDRQISRMKVKGMSSATLNVRYHNSVLKTPDPQTAAAVATMNMNEEMFGQNGFIRKLRESKQYQYLKEKTGKAMVGEMNDDKSKFEGGWASNIVNPLYDMSRTVKQTVTGEDFTDSNGKKHSMKNGSLADILKGWATRGYANTMQYMFGDDYKKDKYYKKMFGWTSSFTHSGDFADDATKSKLGFSSKSLKKQSYQKLSRPPKRMAPSPTFTARIKSFISKRGRKEGETASAASVIHEASEAAADEIGHASRVIGEVALGEDSDSADPKKINKKLNKDFLKTIKKRLPKIFAGGLAGAMIPLLSGGSMGALGLLLPGNPLGGAIVGSGLAMLYQTEKFQQILYGKKDENGERSGGIISKKLKERFKKAVPIIVGGSVLGAIKSAVFGGTILPGAGVLTGTLLPGGILGGALVGMATALVWRSEKFQKTMFGEKDEDGKRTGGKLSNLMNRASGALSKSWGHIHAGAKGAAIGGVSAAVIGQMGLLGAALTPGGIIGGALFGLGMGIASQTEKFKTLMFGEKDEETGKRTHQGLLSRFENMLRVNIIDPVRVKTGNAIEGAAIWLKKNLSIPFTTAFGPLFNSLKVLGDNISDMVKETFEKVGEGFTKVLQKVFSPVLSFVLKSLGKTFNVAGKTASFGLGAVGQLLVSPIKMMSFMMSPKLMKENLKFAGKYFGDKFSGVNAQFEGKKPSLINKIRQGKGLLSALTGTDDYWEQKEAYGNEKFASKLMRNAFLIGRTKKEVKAEEKEHKAKSINDNKVLALNRKYSKMDKRRTGDLLPAEVQRRIKEYGKLGIDPSRIKSSSDLDQLTYNYAGFKTRSVNENEAANVKQASDRKTDAFRHAVTSRLDTITSALTGKVIKAGGKFKSMNLTKKEVGAINVNEFDTESILEKALAKQAERQREYDEYNAEVSADKNKESTEGKASRFLSFKNKAKGAWGKAKTLWSDANTSMDANGNVKKKSIFGTIFSLLGGGMLSLMGGLGSFLMNPLGVGLLMGGVILGSKALGKLMGINYTDMAFKIGGVVNGAVKSILDFASSAIRSALGFAGGTKDTIVGAVRSMLGLADSTGEFIGYDSNGNPIYVNNNQKIQEKTTEGIAKTATGAYRNTKSGISLLKSTSARWLGQEVTSKMTGLKSAAGKTAGEVSKEAVERTAKREVKSIYDASGNVIKTIDAGVNDNIVKESNTKNARKFFTAAKEIFDKLFKSETVKKLIKDNKTISGLAKGMKGAIDKIFSGVLKNINSSKITSILSKGMKKITKGAATVIPIVGWAAQIGFSIYDVTTGAFEAANLFKVDSDAVDWKMRIISSFLKLVTGFSIPGTILSILLECADIFLNIPAKQMIALSLYGAISSEEETADLQKEVDKFALSAEEYNALNGTNLSVSEYNNLVNETGIGAVTHGGKSDYNPEGVKEKKRKKSSKKDKKTGSTSRTNRVMTSARIRSGFDSSDIEGYGNTVHHQSQANAKWKDYSLGKMPDGSTSTMGKGGCGPTALSMLSGASPLDVAKMAKSSGYITDGGANSRLFTEGASRLGLSGTTLGANPNSIQSALAYGNPVIVAGSSNDKNSVFTKAGHIVTLSGTDGRGNVIVDDPLKSKSTLKPMSSISGVTNSWMYKNVGYGDFALNYVNNVKKSKERKASSTPIGPMSLATGVTKSQQKYLNTLNNTYNYINNNAAAGNNYGGTAIPQGQIGSGSGAVTITNGAVYYKQSDPEWASTKIGNATIGGVGCVVTCFAMAAASLSGKRITPTNVAQDVNLFSGQGGILSGFTNKFAKSYNLKVQHLSDLSGNNFELIKAALTSRKPVILYGNKYNDNIWWQGNGSGTHAVLGVGMTGNTIYINDPGIPSRSVGYGIDKIRHGFKWAKIVSDSNGNGISDSTLQGIKSSATGTFLEKLGTIFGNIAKIGENTLGAWFSGGDINANYRSIFDSIGSLVLGSDVMDPKLNNSAKSPGMYPGFGLLSKQFEGSGMTSVDEKNVPPAIGKWQFTGGTIRGFLDTLAQQQPAIYNRYFKKFSDLNFTNHHIKKSSDFYKAWVAACKVPGFEDTYNSYGYNMYGKPAEDKFYKKYGKSVYSLPNAYAVREALFSSAINHGSVGDYLADIPTYTTDRQFIQALYNSRRSHNRNSSALVDRYNREEQTALGALLPGYGRAWYGRGSGYNAKGSGGNDIVSSIYGNKTVSNGKVINIHKNGYDFNDVLGYGPSSRAANNIPRLTQKLNVAVNTDGVENKLDILIGVMREYLANESDRAVGYGNLNVFRGGDSNVAINKSSTPKVTPQPVGSDNLRKVHDIIARGVRL